MIQILLVVLVLELWMLWWIYFHETSFFETYAFITFYFKCFCGYVFLTCFNESSTITESTPNGEIVRQVFIGE